jgi:SAM-dependent methyltransferase
MMVKTIIPWYTKILSKIILSRIPSNYRLWQRIGIFKHGQMEQPAYALKVFKMHYERVDFTRKGKGFVVLELGPGDSLFSALIADAFNASESYLIDAGQFARHDLALYQIMINYLIEQGLTIPNVTGINTLAGLLKAYNAHYGTEGVNSLRQIPDGTVDFIWSQAVLEHIRMHEFHDTMLELRRVLRPDGVCSHSIDLKDHIGGALNNLRFSKELWESDFMAHSGFYTNRIRYNEMLDLFNKAGFEVNVIHVDRWDKMPTRRYSFSKEFRNLSEDELRICGFDVVLRPR